ncbi:peptide chain release factor N(5)-glutamine methyltransferase [Aliidiomarina sp. Khilg15.8]
MDSNYVLSNAIQYGKAQVALGGSSSALLDAQLLLQHVLQCDRQYLYMHPERKLTESEWQAYRDLIRQRREGRPIAYICGEREFWSLPFLVNDSTLIPRPDSEILVEQALRLDLPAQARVLELGTGSGAIALALASERPEWRIDAVDRSAAAVDLAQQNRAKLALHQVNIFASDWFSEVADEGYDLIISNPPYIAQEDQHLQQGDVRFEPETALIADNDGYADLQTIIEQAPGYLNRGGWLLLEHGYEQGRQVHNFFAEKGYEKVNTVPDYANLDRVTYAQCNKI